MTAAPPVRVRFAPSPSGPLHVGNARTALFNWVFARSQGGTFLLRIEDTDVERSTAASEEAIYDDLSWLGIDWDEGPAGIGGPYGPYRQSERRAGYEKAADELLAAGAVYRCFCGTEQLETERDAQRRQGLAPRYTGKCRGIPEDESRGRGASEPHTLRFHVGEEEVSFDDLIRGPVRFPGSQIGDPVIVRADGSPTYNFAVVVDDIGMKITHVIRGEDHISNTPRQMLIYRALAARPPSFAHVPLVLGPDGSPLSKRHGATSVTDFRERGFLPEAMVNYLVMLGWAHPEGKEILTVPEIVKTFSLDRVGRAGAMFDTRKLTWLNAHHLRAASPGRLADGCRPYLHSAGFVSSASGSAPFEDWLCRALSAHTGQMETLADAVPATRGLFRFMEYLGDDPAAAAAVAALGVEPRATEVVARFADQIESKTPPRLADRETFRAVASEVGRALGLKGRALYHPIRVALTAAETGPELDRLVPLIEEGSLLPSSPAILSCAQRVRHVAGLLAGGI